MDISSLPDYPVPPITAPNARIEQASQGLSWRATRILLELTLLVVTAVLLWWHRGMVPAPEPPPPRPPLDFTLVKARFGQVRMLAPREEIHELLGPPTPSPRRQDWYFDLREWVKSAEHSHRHLGIPKDRFWDLWIDPQDEGKGVAVLFADGKVYKTAKKGF